MPTMMEIYKKHATEYDALVNAEDYQNNLSTFLKTNFDWKDKIVYEAGIGTGRVTSIFIEQVKTIYGCDREQHMLDQCGKNLDQYKEKLNLFLCENTELLKTPQKSDIFIEGWSLGHTIVENEANYWNTLKSIFSCIKNVLSDSGYIILIESLGTNVSSPGTAKPVMEAFHSLLVNEYGFTQNIIRTDYMFESIESAAEIMGFFFGDKMKAGIISDKLRVIPEYTGIWVKQF